MFVKLFFSIIAGAALCLSAAAADEFPLTIEHKFGTTVIEEQPKRIESLTEGENFVVNISFEAIELLDADLVVWMAYSGFDDIYNLTGRPFLNAAKEGREIFMGDQLASALSHASLLSIPFAIEQLEPMIKAALDGNPNSHKDNRND